MNVQISIKITSIALLQEAKIFTPSQLTLIKKKTKKFNCRGKCPGSGEGRGDEGTIGLNDVV